MEKGSDTDIGSGLTAVDSVVIRFAGDSGDGMQLTGARFTSETAVVGNDLATRPDFPAEIRAPAGSLPGVSSFQIHFGQIEIHTAGDELDVLVAMNPAALKVNLGDLKQNGILICNSDAFTEKNLARIAYDRDPLEDEELRTRYRVVDVAITSLTHEALKELDLAKSAADKCKNFFALGIICWLYNRRIEHTTAWIESKFKDSPNVIAANKAALHGGMAYAEAAELIAERFEVGRAQLPAGTYRNITGNTALAYGLVAARELSGLPLFYAGYPITPASDVLHEIARHKNFGVTTFQAEDEIAACCAAIGAAYGGALGVTASSGPGIALKQEAIGLAVMTELPLVIIDVQRAGPSTGMPTKTEQSDLLQVMFGRNGECPCVVLAISRPSDAFEATIEACRIALEHMVPVFLLSDGYIGTASEPWCLPELSQLETISVRQLQSIGANFTPYDRDPETLARLWALPGTAGGEHRIGGLEKQDLTGNISYDPENHQRMTNLRAEKVARVADHLQPLAIDGPDRGELLVLGWGSTYLSIAGAVSRLRERDISVSHLHLRHLNPLPIDLEQVLHSFNTVVVPELNMGQLALLLRSKYLVDVQSLCKVQGQPFKVAELETAFQSYISRSGDTQGIASHG